MKRKEKDLFNPAFKGLKEKLDRLKPTKTESISFQDNFESERGGEDIESFNEAMDGVTPLPLEKKKSLRSWAAHFKPSHPPPDDQKTTIAHLHGLVNGSVELDITFSDEYVEGAVSGFSRKLMKRLKRGELPVQDHIDLHGRTRQQAESAVKDFVYQSYRSGLRCILIVHGRGLNSPDSFPVLKEGLPLWLGRGKTGKLVLAFSTARPYDGGTGATYVLLRKR
jgi:DNA-nicking Smr family endonuclease